MSWNFIVSYFESVTNLLWYRMYGSLKRGGGRKSSILFSPGFFQDHLDATKIEMKANVYFIYFHPIGHEDLH